MGVDLARFAHGLRVVARRRRRREQPGQFEGCQRHAARPASLIVVEPARVQSLRPGHQQGRGEDIVNRLAGRQRHPRAEAVGIAQRHDDRAGRGRIQ